MGRRRPHRFPKRAGCRRLTECDVSPDSEDERHTDSAPDDGRDSGKTLGTLLESHAELLLTVLSYVAADALHECRLVCHRWREACRKLPVEIRGVRPAELHAAAESFPEAASLSTSDWLGSDDEVNRHLVPHLPRFEKLNRLCLLLSVLPLDFTSLVPCIQSMRHLRSLSLSIGCRETVHEAMCAVRCLKKLASLEVRLTCDLYVEVDPVTELRELSELKVDIRILLDRRGGLLFPSLTGLTRLAVGDLSRSAGLDLQVRASLYVSFLARCLLSAPVRCPLCRNGTITGG